MSGGEEDGGERMGSRGTDSTVTPPSYLVSSSHRTVQSSS